LAAFQRIPASQKGVKRLTEKKLLPLEKDGTREGNPSGRWKKKIVAAVERRRAYRGGTVQKRNGIVKAERKEKGEKKVAEDKRGKVSSNGGVLSPDRKNRGKRRKMVKALCREKRRISGGDIVQEGRLDRASSDYDSLLKTNMRNVALRGENGRYYC